LPEILNSARKHGLSDDRVLHAYRNPFRVENLGEITVLVGADQAGRLLEVGLVTDGGIEYIIHAMLDRPDLVR
jgi:hypothetical protein